MTDTRNSSRRTFLSAAAGAVVVGTLPISAAQTAQRKGLFQDHIKKAVKFHMVTDKLSASDKLKMLKDLGFDGVEPRAALKETDRAQVRELARASDSIGLPIHGVINSSNPNIKAAIDQAKYFGASSVLHVVRYDRNISYLKNYEETLEIIRRAVDHAEKNEIHILIENVWASHLIEPLGMARFVDELDSPWVQVYFDIGNVVRWGWPQHWIEVLGKRVVKLDVKEFDLDVAMNEGMRKAFNTPLGEGSIDWKKVRNELQNLNFRGWATAEVKGGDRQRLAEIAEQMNRVLDL